MENTVPPFIVFHKQSVVIVLFLLSLGSTFAQVKIGDNPQSIDSASLLELEGTDKTMVLSRITTTQMQAITPLQGAIVYNIEEQCVFYYNGLAWMNLCKDASGFSIVDNGNNTYTVNDGINPEFTFSTNTETITNIVQNPDGTYTYTNEAGEETLIATSATGTSTFSITDNGNNTYTFNDGTIPAFTLSANPETITNIVQNPDGTYTYTNEAGEETLIATSATGTSTLSITDNGNNTYTFNDGTIPAFTLSANLETITNIVQNPNGTFTYTNEAGEETVIANGSGTGMSTLSIVDNGDNTYTVNDGVNPEFTIIATPETVTNITQNTDGSYTYTNEAGEETIIASSALTITDNGDNTYTFNDGTNPAFTITATPETVTNITQNTDGSYTYTNEAGEETIIASSALTITDNGDNTYTVNDGTNPSFTITATPETVTNITQNTDGTYTYTNEAGEEATIASSALAITDNGDNTYTVDDGVNPEFIITAKPETITSITENTNGTYTYTNESNQEVIISLSGTSEEGSVFFADNSNGFGENNTQFFWDNINERLGIGTNTNLTDKLTLNGTLGIADGSVSEPSYRFSADPDTGIFRSDDNEIGFTVGGTSNMKLTETGLYLNNALPIDPSLTDMPLLIRANEGELFGLQRTNGDLKWILNLREQTSSVRGGLSFVELGINSRFFIENTRNPSGPDFGRIGINTDNPQETLHVVGNMRVTDLPPSAPNDNIVTVDEFGRFHKSTNTVASRSAKNSEINFMARWMNTLINIPLTNGRATLPIFGVEDINDGGGNYCQVVENELHVKTNGVYEIKATIALSGNLQSNGLPANTYARISVNDVEKGAINVAGYSGATDSNSLSSIHLNDILKLQTGDKVAITLFSNASASAINLAGSKTSNFTIIKR
ncbi:hypothetical protein FGM00_01195 [Aggregatimonas sangjinii]|uniref:Uncharacterized protein n=1 Tax=Aggregatimonas sangjinii TaxID=2583587 RepID=A0A5B7SP54_9FLAO|nr:hypothetical protein [Aggregatimonas sangjinii]QCW98799.1 hypothetical protein FGM00_01195 [Aggregatimonas sangjinii]